MLSKNDRNEEKVLKLQSFARPPLPGGTYVLKTKLFTDAGKDGLKGMPSKFEAKEIKFQITAPRFGISTELIHSVYPLPGSTGDYQNTLPHIVLKRKTFCWERVIDGNKTNFDKPWVCLLVFTEEEVKLEQIKEMTTETFLKEDADVKVPILTLNEDEKIAKTKLKALELDMNLFKRVAPKLDEINFLAHNRQVNTNNKGNNDTNGDKGWYTTVVANRLPIKGITNYAFLVSIEGCTTYMEEPMIANDSRKLRLCLLHQWQFIDMDEKLEDVVKNLNNNVKPLTIELKEGANPTEHIKRCLDFGYAPINHIRRNDEKSVSWYRGPFVPLNAEHHAIKTYKNADQALRFDANTNMFDISYASAWQLGRLLALQDSSFSIALSNWKNAYKRDRPIKIAKDLLLKQNVNQELLSSFINDAESDEVLTDYLIELWNKNTK
ncbi:hypothetical protein FA048_16470 [Pedobacter polaris]|uniref:Uncharacterized protein n=1 Tax=Pedobacter polaris TaxID=2571273 RepID=A0A4U1CHN9_9SPHI|nr:hypothetical protein [Pedobacter polaris]TKC06791.1 hypothetical protein FA048_16470 [Pedobacter polaris]